LTIPPPSKILPTPRNHGTDTELAPESLTPNGPNPKANGKAEDTAASAEARGDGNGSDVMVIEDPMDVIARLDQMEKELQSVFVISGIVHFIRWPAVRNGDGSTRR